jgi:NCAIR mutase (PurE)-related protein
MANNQRKVIVAYKVVPGEPENCIVVTTENLGADEHDTLIKLVESSAGQEAEDLATAMMRTSLPDGSNMLARFHTTGKMVKVPTKTVEMMPNRNTSILLSELNELIAQQKGVTVNDLAVKGRDGSTVPTSQQSEPKITASEMAAQSAGTTSMPTEGVLSDEVLAAKFRSDADRLSKEAAALRRQAEELVPTVKKATGKKTTASA